MSNLILNNSQFAYLPDEVPGLSRWYVRHPLKQVKISIMHGHHPEVPAGHVQIDMGEYGMLEMSADDLRTLELALQEELS